MIGAILAAHAGVIGVILGFHPDGMIEILGFHSDVTFGLVSVAAVVAIIGGVWELQRRSRRSFAESVEAIVCKHVSPVRKDLDALKVEVKADHDELRELVVASAEVLDEINGGKN